MQNVGRTSRNSHSGPRRLQRGVAQAGLLGRLLVAGIILIAVGIFVKPMDWTRPEMLAPLGFDLAMVITNIGIFLVFVGVLNSFFYTPFKEVIDTRNNSLEATFTEAENLKKEMGELRTSYEARLAQTEADAREQIQAQIREAQHLRTTLMAEATARADELLRKAEQDIEGEKQRALAEIRSHVVDLTLNATERLIGHNVDTKVNRKLVDEFIDNMAVTGA
jgi:F-type H+-transporting ATPase subunit b